MFTLQILLSQISETESGGGLFDFNATLPLMALQFLALTVTLNFIFYKPVSNVLDAREEYIRNSLTSASASLVKANELTKKYEFNLAESRKQAQNIIKNAQQEAQLVVSEKIKEAQKDAEQLLIDAYQELNIQKEQALKSLEIQVGILSEQIKGKLLEN
uniref:ATP synthase subunit b', chloroplastic n=1 Tax=Laurencia verruciformis TaxID=3073068 RepID=A0AA51NG73_9FLOR|nr:ATP synthase subunit b' [Laurencia obtusa]WMP12254.1 ATP synthase subunit b' [Laurencia verruciformis]WMP12899.1 ATP synthase subunit b' [Laurencia obtusa]